MDVVVRSSGCIAARRSSFAVVRAVDVFAPSNTYNTEPWTRVDHHDDDEEVAYDDEDDLCLCELSEPSPPPTPKRPVEEGRRGNARSWSFDAATLLRSPRHGGEDVRPTDGQRQQHKGGALVREGTQGGPKPADKKPLDGVPSSHTTKRASFFRLLRRKASKGSRG